MRIDISKLISGNSKILEIRFDEPIELKRDDILEVKGPAHVYLRLMSTDGGLFIRGTVEQKLVVECYRCLEPFEYDLNAEIDENISYDAEEDEVISADKKYLDIDEILRSNVYLSLPMRFLCSDDCKGLCPMCGINLNKGKCDCQRDEVDPRLAVLKKFFDKD